MYIFRVRTYIYIHAKTFPHKKYPILVFSKQSHFFWTNQKMNKIHILRSSCQDYMKKMSPFDCDIRDIRYLNKTKYVVRVCSLFSVFGVFFCKFHHQLLLSQLSL